MGTTPPAGVRAAHDGKTWVVPLRLSALVERLRGSLFFVPMLGVVAAVGLAIVALAVDSRIDDQEDVPLVLASTVESARSLLSTVAGATITFAGIAFSVSLLVIQQASTQYSPRVVHTLFRDPFNKRVMALVLGTFTFCLVVLRSVRSPLEDGGDPVIPTLSVSLALLLGVAAILSVVAFINHNAHSMDISEILERARRQIAGLPRDPWSTAEAPTVSTARPQGEPPTVIRFVHSGWVQQVDVDALLACLPPGTTAELATYPGRYAVQGAALCRLWWTPPDEDTTSRAIREAVSLGESRTMLQDPAYGIRALVDVALRALSPGENDPTTAQDAVFHCAAALVELLVQAPPSPVVAGDDGRRLLLPEQPTDDDLVTLAFEEVRRAAAPHPRVCIYVLEAMALVREAVEADRAELVDLLTRQADLLVAGCEAADVLPADLDTVRRARAARFGRSSGPVATGPV